jgi:hypothetical protein
MRKKTSLFTAAERRLALWALLAAAVLTLTLMSVEQILSPSLGLYASNVSTPSLPNVIDARPLARAL